MTPGLQPKEAGSRQLFLSQSEKTLLRTRSRQPKEPPMEPSGGEQELGAVRLLDLPWEDVLLPHVLSRVPLCQLLRLQRVSRAFRALVQLHLAGLGPSRGALEESHLREVLSKDEYRCDWVDGLALRGLADRCPALEELDLTACRQLKDEAIVYLAQRRGAGLRSLSLAVNANVGDAAVQELARNCPELEHLDLTGCLRVGSDGVRTLAEYCPALRSLRVRHCHHVAEPSLSRLRKRGVDIDVEPPLHQALVLLQDMAGFAPFVNLQV
ncbi:PREDICTED: F-box/LRR-repeat protein 15 [Myotis brandtii]|uniref:F-box/LRR-repeat protein 15 n=1 Tax=Myotis brandtii TaxID=109478 RepID=UPI0007041F48|nr:PREDICTED: F-box/LRR-repeat protein 15 [Myotis brandtii]